jgi:hypothetical protein
MESAALRVKPVACDPVIALRSEITLAWGRSVAVSVPYTLAGPWVPPPPRTRDTVPWAVSQAGMPPRMPGFVLTVGRLVSMAGRPCRLARVGEDHLAADAP